MLEIAEYCGIKRPILDTAATRSALAAAAHTVRSLPARQSTATRPVVHTTT